MKNAKDFLDMFGFDCRMSIMLVDETMYEMQDADSSQILFCLEYRASVVPLAIIEHRIQVAKLI